MERCDFSSVITLMREYISDDRAPNQVDLLYELFAGFLDAPENDDFFFDNGLVCRWIKGQARISPRISSYYIEKKNLEQLAGDIGRNVLPLMYDSPMAIQEIHTLVMQDVSISELKKLELCSLYPCKSRYHETLFLASVLSFSMERPFVKRASQAKTLLPPGSLSPVLADFILDEDIPKPCRNFCGREKELESLHQLLEGNKKVFLHGIAGIGKSELAKAYAKMHRKDYTNILYLTYSGDLSF